MLKQNGTEEGGSYREADERGDREIHASRASAAAAGFERHHGASRSAKSKGNWRCAMWLEAVLLSQDLSSVRHLIRNYQFTLRLLPRRWPDGPRKSAHVFFRPSGSTHWRR